MIATLHTPVLLSQVISYLRVKPGCWYIDATVGGGGYTEAILRQQGNVLGLDTDRQAIERAREHLHQVIPEKIEGKEYILIHDNFRRMEDVVKSNDISDIYGAVFDLGFSSDQLEDSKRGISYKYESAVIDMRLDMEHGEPAWRMLSGIQAEELTDQFMRYGEVPNAKVIAESIVHMRKNAPVLTVGHIMKAIGNTQKGNNVYAVASQVFQSIRMAVNDELQALSEGLQQSVQLLEPHGILAVVSFHSGEDRIVKNFFRHSHELSIITGHTKRPDQEEIERNKRARSAKLRVAEKL